MQNIRSIPLLTRWHLVPLIIGLIWLGSPIQADASLSSEVQAKLAASPLVDPALIEILAQDGVAYAEISFTLPGESDPAYAQHPVHGTDVNPLVFDIVNLLHPGTIAMSVTGLLYTLSGTIDAGGVMALLGNPHVEAIGLGEAPASVDHRVFENDLKVRTLCDPSSTTACLHGNFFSVNVARGATKSKVATTSSRSAAFYFFSSSNWEVLVKVLDGCSVNGFYWVFAAGATTQSYTITVTDHRPNPFPVTKQFSSSCPVANTAAFSCLIPR